jgi:hypothetical protein
MTWTRALTMNILGPSLMGLRGTQVTGAISYTLVKVKLEFGFGFGLLNGYFFGSIHNFFFLYSCTI